MTQIPSDVLNEIFLFLDESNRLECTSVCHYWKRVLDDSALYQTVTLHTIDSLRRLLINIQVKPAILNKIQQLFILFTDRKSYQDELNQLLISLPNIRFLFCAATTYKGPYFQGKAYYPWHESIEYFEDYDRTNSMIFPMLSSNICLNLSTLIIYPGKKNELIPLLKNLLFLKNLTLLSGSVTVHDLDTLHRNVPCLESLSLNNTVIDDIEIDSNPSPAVSVSRFSVSYLYINRSSLGTDLLLYISKKYPNLSELCFAAEYDHMVLNDEEIEYLNIHGWTPFFRNMGPQLHALRLNVGSSISNLFAKLDESKLQIYHLDIILNYTITLTDLMQSQQIHYIHTLSLCGISVKQTFEWLNQFTVLKELILRGSTTQQVNLRDILTHSCSTLRSLVLEGCRLNIDSEYNHESQIDALSLKNLLFPTKMDTFISRYFPKLSKLEVERCKQQRIAWDLPGINLSLFRLNFVSLTEHYHVLVNTYSNDESRLYSVRNNGINSVLPDGHPFKHRTYKSYPYKEINTGFSFTLNCNSLKSIAF